ncbi:hypothetical protein N9L68_02740 [bacterium]|nr:hypothetical protein [bacterium]
MATSHAALENELATALRLWDVMRLGPRTDLPDDSNVFLRNNDLHTNRAQTKKTLKYSITTLVTGPTFSTDESVRYHSGLQHGAVGFAYGMVESAHPQRAMRMLRNPLEALNRLFERLPKLIA